MAPAAPLRGRLEVVRGGLERPGVAALLARHLDHSRGASPAESDHALGLAELSRPSVTVWTAWVGDEVAGVGALQPLGERAGEVKSMHTAAAMRGRGVGGAILRAIIAEARSRGYRTLHLETGTHDAFAASRALYAGHGFVPAPPFGSYVEDPHSAYYRLDLAAHGPAASRARAGVAR